MSVVAIHNDLFTILHLEEVWGTQAPSGGIKPSVLIFLL